MHDADNGNTVVSFQLTEGNHTLKICYREDGAGLDKLYLTNTGNIPSGLGDDADNCQQEGIVEFNHHDESKLFLYPNPADEILIIESESISGSENELNLYNSNGMLVKSIKLENNTYILNVEGLPEGLYFIKLIINNNEILVRKFIKM